MSFEGPKPSKINPESIEHSSQQEVVAEILNTYQKLSERAEAVSDASPEDFEGSIEDDSSAIENAPEASLAPEASEDLRKTLADLEVSRN